jgi:hypothetical protein
MTDRHAKEVLEKVEIPIVGAGFPRWAILGSNQRPQLVELDALRSAMPLHAVVGHDLGHSYEHVRDGSAVDGAPSHPPLGSARGPLTQPAGQIVWRPVRRTSITPRSGRDRRSPMPRRLCGRSFTGRATTAPEPASGAWALAAMTGDSTGDSP